MGFSDDVKRWTGQAGKELADATEAQDRRLAEILDQVLGDEKSRVESWGTFDRETGKFSGLVAPEDIMEKLREAGLLDSHS